MKISLSNNVEVLNKDEAVKALQEGRAPDLVLKPKWYAEYATIGHVFSVPGWTMEEFLENPTAQSYGVFLKGNGSFDFDLGVDAVGDTEEDEDA